MDIHQLKTFVAVAREGSITRTSERLHLSQPAVSAHIKAIEDAVGLTLFERTSRGMNLTSDGQRLLVKAERTLAAHHELMDEATRMKGRLTGKLRLGAGSNSDHEAVGRLLTILSERCPEVEVALKHGTSLEILAGIRNGSLDAGLYNEAGQPDPDLATLDVSTFSIFVVAQPGLVATSDPLDWSSLANVPWIYPTSSACCGTTAESLFKANHIRPRRVIGVDREDVTRSLIAGGLGVGLLHAGTAEAAKARGEVELLFESPTRVRVLLAHLASRAEDPLLMAATSFMSGAQRSRDQPDTDRNRRPCA
jgi:DNA-binding transcriptional LysR family regulator